MFWLNMWEVRFVIVVNVIFFLLFLSKFEVKFIFEYDLMVLIINLLIGIEIFVFKKILLIIL